MSFCPCEIDKLFAGLKIRGQGEVNILLLGETGVGKSTFINSVANYLSFAEFELAEESDLIGLISTKINLFDKITNQRKEINFESTIKPDENETLAVGASATQDVKSYVFPLNGSNTTIRLIDTPGVGDTRALNQDKTNLEKMLSYIENLKHLHAICVLLKPNETRLTAYFEYCIKAIFSHLDKSAAANIVFVFTNSKDTNFNPGETFTILSKTLDDLAEKPPNVRIPLDKNVFCIDNVAFRYLVACKNQIDPGEVTKKQAEESWKKSNKESWRLLTYILGTDDRPGITPHNVLNTKSVNDVRRMINQLSQPLVEVSNMLSFNIRLCERRQMELQTKNQTMEKLKSKLYFPSIDLKITPLEQPTTVCVGMECCEVICVEGINKYHYKPGNRCHDPCDLIGVQKETIGTPELLKCLAFGYGTTKNCLKCGCPYDAHMHIYYISEVVQVKRKDNKVLDDIDSLQKAVKCAEQLAAEIIDKKIELEKEKTKILTTMAHFANFLEKNALTPFNDAYKKYVEYLISSEESLGKDADTENLNQYQEMLKQYESMREAFQKSLELGRDLQYQSLEPKDVGIAIEELYELKHTGAKIKELYESQKKAKTSEYRKLEYVHDKFVNAPNFNKKSTKKSNRNESRSYGFGAAVSRFFWPRNQTRQSNFSREDYDDYDRDSGSPSDSPPSYDYATHSRGHYPPYEPYSNSQNHQRTPPKTKGQSTTTVTSKQGNKKELKTDHLERQPPSYDSYYRPNTRNDRNYRPPSRNDDYYRPPNESFRDPFYRSAPRNDSFYRPGPQNDSFYRPGPQNDRYYGPAPSNDVYYRQHPQNDPYYLPPAPIDPYDQQDPYFRPNDPFYRPSYDHNSPDPNNQHDKNDPRRKSL